MPVLGLLFRLVNNGGRNNTCRNGTDGITQQHDECRKQASNRRYRRDVAIAYGGHRDDGPIDRCGQIGELCIGLPCLNHKHQRAQTGDQYQQEQEVDGNLGQALLELTHQYVSLVDEAEQLENAEDTDEAERTQQHHVSCMGQEVGKIRG